MNTVLACALSQTRIMVVDDDESVRDVVTEVLGRKGWTVDDYSSAEAAISALERGRYDVILTDINMPGLSGMDLLQQIKDAAPQTPVVMITGFPSIDLAVEAMKIGAVDFLAKPFKFEELEIVVRKAIDGSRSSAEHIQDPPSRLIPFDAKPAAARRRLEDKIRELSILHTISDAINDAGAKEDIFRKTMDIAQIITDSDRAFIMVADQDASSISVSASSGYGDVVLAGERFSSIEEPFATVMKTKSYAYVAVDDPALARLMGPSEGPVGRRPLLLAPMTINREVVVLLGLTGSSGAGVLSADTLSLLLNLMAKASMKLENVALSENVFSSIIGAINSLINALDARDTYTRDHSNRVTRYAVQIARSLGCSHDVIDSINFAGPLHDIGKIGVRDEILLKKGSFSIDEKEVMQSHVTRGEEILRPLNLMQAEKAVVLYHHERWDGGGYPNGLGGSEIPLAARIFSVADTFDAMTSTRPYRNALSLDIARQEILRCSGTQFDPEIVDAFLNSEIMKER